jgi:hypothetical protein
MPKVTVKRRSSLKKGVTNDPWQQSIHGARDPLGKVLWRKL